MRAKASHVRWCRLRAALGGLLLSLSASVNATDITLSIDDVASPAFQAKSIKAKLSGSDLSQLEAQAGEVSSRGRTWRNVGLTCSNVRLEPSSVQCQHGKLLAGEPLPFGIRYTGAPRRLDLTVNPTPGEAWRGALTWNASGWQGSLQVANGKPGRLAWILPESMPKPGAGTLTGLVKLGGDHGGLNQLASDLTLQNVAFSDAAGLHAGEKLRGRIQVNAARRRDAWHWRGDAVWQSGEVFWQPLYFAKGGHHIVGEGIWKADRLQLAKGNLHLAGVGDADLSGVWDLKAKRPVEFDLRGVDLDLDGLYGLLLKPFLGRTVLAQAHAAGRADLDWRYRDGATTLFDLALREASVEEENQRFALHGVNVRFPWASGEERQADIRIQSGQLLHIPLGPVQLPLAMRGWDFSLPAVTVPVLDGALNIDGFEAKKSGVGWRWRFSGALAPISMEGLSTALKLPVMHGSLAGIIPRVTYAAQPGGGSELKMDGALLIRAFDGTVVVKNLALYDPLGRAPRLMADVDMRNLDLDLLTRTFSFGQIQGRIDVTVNNLELSNWRPVKFDAELRSSPGSYPKKISQRAVENITALGGAGAAAAIQRSFLRFFQQFGYNRIGLSCTLRNGVCLMDGVAPAPQGYLIVEGGGIPAINVIGYNHHVSWDVLLERLQRITQSNVKPVVQ